MPKKILMILSLSVIIILISIGSVVLHDRSCWRNDDVITGSSYVVQIM
ncbi:MAG: hypothetical protein PUA84_05950 [Oscillospiraceae bacterium]|nr:hypothetical protein [Oscillospiraceae bacterium]